MKIQKHGNRFRIAYRCPNFHKTIHETFTTIEEAELRLAQIKLDKARGTLLPPPELVDPTLHRSLYRQTITVRQLLEEYVNLYGLNHWSESTLSCNQHRIKDYILPFIGDVPIKALTTHQLEAFYRTLLTQPAVPMKGREDETRCISHSVVERVHTILRSALNQAIRWDYLSGSNPAMVVELPQRRKKHREAWDEKELYEALRLCDDPILSLCIYLAVGCSMRIGEILGLTWDCIHMEPEVLRQDSAYLRVEKELRRCQKDSLDKLAAQGRSDVYFAFPLWKQSGATTVLVLKAPKTESSVRTIYLPAAVAERLQQEREHQRGIKEQNDGCYQDFNLVVAQPNGRPYEEHIIIQKLKKLIKKNGLRPVVFHSLRHTSTSMKLKLSGGDIKAVQGDTGHAQSNMVTDVYSHIVDADRVHLARKMNEEFFALLSMKAAGTLPPEEELSDSMKKILKYLKESPEKAESLMLLLGLK